MPTKLAARTRFSYTLLTKYGLFWLQKSKMATVKLLNSWLPNSSKGDYVHIVLWSMALNVSKGNEDWIWGVVEEEDEEGDKDDKGSQKKKN